MLPIENFPALRGKMVRKRITRTLSVLLNPNEPKDNPTENPPRTPLLIDGNGTHVVYLYADGTLGSLPLAGVVFFKLDGSDAGGYPK